MGYYWFNIKLGYDFEYGEGVYASWVNLRLTDNGEILWENADMEHYRKTGEQKTVWSDEPSEISFEYKEEIVPFVKENPQRVVDAVIESHKNGTIEDLYPNGKFTVYCHGHYDN